MKRTTGKMGIRAVLFDLDDTLLDDTRATLAYRKQFYANHREAIPFEFEEFYAVWEEQVTTDLANLAQGVSGIHESRRCRMRIVFGNPGMSDQDADRYIREYLDLYRAAWVLYGDTVSALTDLHDRYALAVVTNGDRQQQNEKITRFGLAKYFKVVVTCEDAKASKPDRRIFDAAASRLAVAHSECLFVGDSYERDAVAARDAGMKSAWLVRGGDVPRDCGDGIVAIRGLSDIRAMLAEACG